MYLKVCVCKKRIRVGGRDDAKSRGLMLCERSNPYGTTLMVQPGVEWQKWTPGESCFCHLPTFQNPVATLTGRGKKKGKIKKCDVRRTHRKMQSK